MKREVKIIIETERTIEISGSERTVENWCEQCAAHTTMVSLEMAAAIANVGTGAISYWIENAEFHFRQSSAGRFRICQRSFLDHLRRLNFMPRSKRDASQRVTKTDFNKD